MDNYSLEIGHYYCELGNGKYWWKKKQKMKKGKCLEPSVAPPSPLPLLAKGSKYPTLLPKGFLFLQMSLHGEMDEMWLLSLMMSFFIALSVVYMKSVPCSIKENLLNRLSEEDCLGVAMLEPTSWRTHWTWTKEEKRKEKRKGIQVWHHLRCIQTQRFCLQKYFQKVFFDAFLSCCTQNN